jgi:hypothetical protein
MTAAIRIIANAHAGRYPPGDLHLGADGRLHGASRADLEHKCSQFASVLAKTLEENVFLRHRVRELEGAAR